MNFSSSSDSSRVQVNDRLVYWGLLTLLVWAPMPLASVHIWGMEILVIFSQVLLLGVAYAWRHAAFEAMARLKRFALPVGLLAVFVVLVWCQLLPLEGSWLSSLSPESLLVQEGVSSLRLSLDPYQTRVYAALSFAYLSCFVVTILVVRDAQRLDQLAQLLIYSGLLQALIGVFLFSTGASYQMFFYEVIHANVQGAYGNRNHFAGYMEICLSVGIGLMLARLGSGEPSARGRDWRQKFVAVFEFVLGPKMRLRMVLIILVIALVLTRSRMGNTAFFAAMLIIGVLSLAVSRKLSPATIALIASLVIVDVVIIGTWVGLEKVVERVSETGLTKQSGLKSESVEQREEAAMYALDLVRDFPVFGTGAGSFYYTYIRYRTPTFGYFDHAHNDFVEFAADYGLLGLGILALFVLLTAFKSIQNFRHRNSSLPRGIAFGSLMATLSIMIHSSVDFNLQIPANALTLVVVMSMAWIAYELPRGEIYRTSSKPYKK